MTRARRPPEAVIRAAQDRFRRREDTREDRDILRAARIDWMTDVNGAGRDVPTVEEEEAALKPKPEEPSGRAPRVWKMGR